MPITFPSRSAYRREVKRRFAKIMPPLLKYAAPSGAATCPLALRQEIPLADWLDLPQEDRESIIKAAIRNMIHADLGPLPAPAEGEDKPRPRLDPAALTVEPAPVEAAEPEPAPIATRYFTLCAECGEPVGVVSRRARFVFCSAKACAEARKNRV